MSQDNNLSAVDRRSILKATGGLGIAGLAGCLGDGNGDAGPTTLTAGCSSRGTTSFASCQAMQAAADEHSDEIEFEATAPGGDPAAIRQLDQGEIEVRTAGNFISDQAANDIGAFEDDPVDESGHLVMSFTTIEMYWMQKEDAGYDSLEDAVEQEAPIWGFPAGWGLRRLLESTLDEAGRLEDFEPLFEDIAADEVPGALEEDRVEVFAAYGSGGASLAGWVVETDSRIDVEALETPDWFWDEGVANSAAIEDSFEPYGWDQDIGTDELRSWVEGFNMYAHPNVDNDDVYEMLRIATEHTETVQNAERAFLDGSDPANLTSVFWDHPIHDGAREFFEDEGVDL